jgi:hypothetical protein
MTDRELMQQALEALEKMKAHSYLRLDYAEEAISALRERLAQPEDWQYVQKLNSFSYSRPWVGLTKEEAKEISLAHRPYVIDMIAALEARLKEKNNG